MGSPLGARLDQGLTTLALLGGAAGRRVSWWLGQSAEQRVRRLHEALLRRWRASGRFWVAASLAEAAWATRPDEAPRHPSPFWPADRASRRARELRDGSSALEDGRQMPVQDVPWFGWAAGSEPAGGAFRMQSLNWVGDLLQAHSVTGDRRYADRAVELARSWIAACLGREEPELIWDDHGTALRAVVLCQVWHRLGEAGGSSQAARELLTAIVRHGSRLALPAFYRPGHNHGVPQAYALLAIGLGVPGLPAAAAWRALGMARLEAQLRDNVSPEGLHREHSPFYHFFVLRHLLEARALAGRHGLHFSSGFEAKVRAMIEAASHLVKPDGALAALGDTTRTSPTLVDELLAGSPDAEVAHYRWARTCGAAGRPGPEVAALFPQAGYASLRSGWGGDGRPADERHLVVRLATFDTAHVHRDVLSFELYGYGDDLVVDSGGPYAYGHPLRGQYFLTTRAHNTVAVDGRNQHIGAAKVLAWTPDAACAVLVAEHGAYDGVTHRRALVFVRGRFVLVLDRVRSGEAHLYSQLFHLNPALDIVTRDLAVATTHRDGGPSVRLVPLLTDGLALRLHHGASQPHQGWVCVAPHRMVAGHVVEYQRTSAAATFAALLVPERPDRPVALRAALEGRLFEEYATVRVEVDGEAVAVAVAPDGRASLAEGARAR